MVREGTCAEIMDGGGDLTITSPRTGIILWPPGAIAIGNLDTCREQ